jgi:hypothetical protein
VNSLNVVQFQSAGVSDRRLKGEGFWGGEGEQCSRVGEGERQRESGHWAVVSFCLYADR